jgi:hypothetical protein
MYLHDRSDPFSCGGRSIIAGRGLGESFSTSIPVLRRAGHLTPEFLQNSKLI